MTDDEKLAELAMMEAFAWERFDMSWGDKVENLEVIERCQRIRVNLLTEESDAKS